MIQRERYETREVLDISDYDGSACLHDPRVCPELTVFRRRNSDVYVSRAPGEPEYRLPRNRLSQTHCPRNESCCPSDCVAYATC